MSRWDDDRIPGIMAWYVLDVTVGCGSAGMQLMAATLGPCRGPVYRMVAAQAGWPCFSR
jgi:hypothetical protein